MITMTRLAALLTVAGAALAPLGKPAQPEKEPPAQVGAPTDIERTWGKRLEALIPERPMEYFLLGEEVAAQIDGEATRRLARELFVLAYELDAKHAGSRSAFRLGPSVCLALAAIAERDDESRWLRALAETMTDRPIGSLEAGAGASAYPLEAAFNVATAMGLARAGEGRRAEQCLEKPGAAELLEKLEAAPSFNRSTTEIRHFLRRAIRDWPVCPQCRNRRVVPAGVSRQGEMILCDTCRGNPGPKMTEAELASQLRVEAMLLQGTHRSWAAQVLADDGAPLRDLDIGELAGTYRVDVTKPLWRNGAWTEDGTSAPAPAPQSPAPAQREKPSEPPAGPPATAPASSP